MDHMIQVAEEAVEYAKANNLSRQEVIDAENELAKAVQAKNSWYWVQKAGLNAEACYKFNLIFNNRDCQNIFYWGCCLYAALDYIIDVRE